MIVIKETMYKKVLRRFMRWYNAKHVDSTINWKSRRGKYNKSNSKRKKK